MSVLSRCYFHDEAAAFKHVERMVWANGRSCPHCGVVDNSYALKGVRTKPSKKNPQGVIRHGLYKCGACRKQFTVRIGTIFEESHLPLHLWLQAIHLMCSSKKGVSAHQLSRILEIQYKSAWFLAHRIREAMRLPLEDQDIMGGIGRAVELDETYVGGKVKNMPKSKRAAAPKGGSQGNASRLAVRRLEAERPTSWHVGKSIGSIVGELKKVDDFDHDREFVIVPAVGAAAVTCTFPDSMRTEMGQYLFSIVKVSGILHYGPDSPFPILVEAGENGIEHYPAIKPRRTLAQMRGVFEGREPAEVSWNTLLDG